MNKSTKECNEVLRIDIDTGKEEFCGNDRPCWLHDPLSVPTPMGASNWKNYGLKYGYWNFFETEIRKDWQQEINNKAGSVFGFESGKQTMKAEIFKMVMGMVINTPEQVAELNEELPSTIQEHAYHEAIGYKKAVEDLINKVNGKA